MATERDLREKLLQHELDNLRATLDNIESLGYPIDSGILDWAKDAAKGVANTVKKTVMGGPKTAQDVMNMLHKAFPGTNVDKSGDSLTLTVNGKPVEVKLSEGTWMLTVDGATYKAQVDKMESLQTQIKTLTATQISGTKMQEVMRGSRVILLSQRCGFVG